MRAVLTGALLAACGPTHQGDTVDASHPDAGDVDAPPTVDTSRVYAHSGGMLYRLNNVTLEPVVVGTLSGLGTQSLTDLAIDKNDTMVGITLDKLYGINNQNGQVALIKDLSAAANGFTSLSFIPEDMSDPNSNDILVSANDQGDVFEIDVTTGGATKIGNYGTVALGKVRSSGDLFAVRGLGIFATVDVGTAKQDYLAQIDPAAGWKATPLGAGTGFDKIFGVGYWGGRIYGFVDGGANAGGKVIEIDQSTGAGKMLSAGDVRWFGAGVATSAPIF